MRAPVSRLGVFIIWAACLGTAAHARSPLSVVVPSLAGAVVVGPEVAVEPIEATDGGAVAPGDQFVPAIASDGTSAFVVWEDRRNASAPAIVGSRVSAPGEVLDPEGITIAGGATPHNAPAIAFDGANYLVVWSERRGGDYGVFGARVTPAGVVLDAPGFVIDDSPGDQLSPGIASNGAVSLVAWNGAGGASRDIWAVRIASGAVAPIEPSSIAVYDQGGLNERPAVAFGGGTFLVTWLHERNGTADRDIRAAAVDALSGTLTDNDIPITTSGAVEHPAVAASQGEFLVAWSDERLGWPKRDDLYVARVGFDGGVVDPEGVNVVSEDGMEFLSSVGFDGTYFLVNSFRTRVAAGEPYEAVTRRLTRTLQVVPPGQIALWGADPGYTHYTPRMVVVGGSILFVWERTTWVSGVGGGLGPLDVRLSRLPIGANAIAEPPRLVSSQAWSQKVGAVTASESGWTIVWSDARAGAEALRARWLGPGPTALGSSVPVTAPLDAGGGFAATAVAAIDGGVLAVWARAIDGGAALFSSVVTRDGGAPGRSVAVDPGSPGDVVAVTAGVAVSVAWAVSTPVSTAFQAVQLDSAGASLGSPELLATSRAQFEVPPRPALGFNPLRAAAPALLGGELV